MDRRSTDFQIKITALLEKALNSSTYAESLTYYQIIASEFCKFGVAKGLVIFHHMGLGKTILAYHIIYELRKLYPEHTPLVISPKSHITNFKETLAKYKEITGNDMDEDLIKFVKSSIATEKYISELDPHKDLDVIDGKLEHITKKLTNLDGFIIFLEEAHMFMRRVANGSKVAVRLYDMMMKSDCKVFMLTGSAIASRPFELAPMLNLASGSVIFPENEAIFNEYFIKDGKMRNKARFQDRIYGLVSRMKPEYLPKSDASEFPTKLPDEIINVEMDDRMLRSYIVARSNEIMDERKMEKHAKKKPKNVDRFKKKDGSSGTYRVRSRQACNFVQTPELKALFERGGYEQDEVEDIIYKMPLNVSGSSKCDEMKKIIKKRKGQQGVIYSNFTAFAGACSIASHLLKCGATEIFATGMKAKYTVEKETKEMEGYKFARINGRLSEEEQMELVKLYNDGKIDFIIIGVEQCMGLDLKKTRWEIAYEVPFIWFILDQLQYRGNRRGSHKGMKKEDQNITLYILVSVYPKDFDIRKIDFDDEDFDADIAKEMLETTDQFMLGLMNDNKKITTEFKNALEEVSIECEVAKKVNPESNHKCRTCTPNNKMLFNDDPNAIMEDLDKESPCVPLTKKEIKAKKIVITINGEKLTYYYTENKNNIYGYDVYVKDGEETFRVMPGTPIFEKVMDSI